MGTEERVWLIVEDEKPLRDVLISTLKDLWGITPLVFADGEQATNWLDQVEAGTFDGKIPELALLDIFLPRGPQGHEIAHRLHSIPVTAHVGIVMLTGFLFEDDERTEIEETAKPDLFIQKPYPELDEFREMLEEVVRKKAM